ncbi:MAG: two-component regulator propeller domain-containing protein, partial [Bacteroidota bacterium]
MKASTWGACISIMILCWHGPVWGQSYWLRQFGPQQGLASNTIYRIAQDELGFLWLATDYGLAQYDGQRFEYYSHPDLRNSEIIQLHIQDSILSFVNLPGQAGTLNIHEPTVKVKAPSIQGLDRIRDLQIDYRGGRHWLIEMNSIEGKNRKVFTFFSENSDRRLTRLSEKDQPTAGFFTLNREELLAVTYTKIGESQQRLLHYKRFDNQLSLQHTEPLTETFSEGTITPYIYFNQIEQSTYFITQNQNLYRWQAGKNIRIEIQSSLPLPNRFLAITQDLERRLWLATTDGAFRLDSIGPDRYRLGKQVLAGIVINTIYSDTDGNLWFGTNQKGLFMLPFDRYYSLDAPTLDKRHFPIKRLIPIQDTTVVGMSALGKLLILESGKYRFQSLLEPADYNGICVNDQDQFLVYANGDVPGRLFQWDREQSQEISLLSEAPPRNIKYAIPLNSGFLMGTGRRLIHLSEISPTAKLTEQLSGRMLTLLEDTFRNQIWLGSAIGLRLYKEQGTSPLYQDQAGDSLTQFITALALCPDGSLLLGTQNNGLWRIKDDQIEALGDSLGISARNIKDLEVDYPLVWAVTRSEVLKIDLKSKQVYSIEQSIGTPISDPYDLCLTDSSVW